MDSSSTFLARGVKGISPMLTGPMGAVDRVLDGLLQPVEVDVQAPQDVGGHALALADHAQQQVLGPDVVVLQPAGLVPGQEQHLAHSLGESVVHAVAPPFACFAAVARVQSPAAARPAALVANILERRAWRYHALRGARRGPVVSFSFAAPET